MYMFHIVVHNRRETFFWTCFLDIISKKLLTKRNRKLLLISGIYARSSSKKIINRWKKAWRCRRVLIHILDRKFDIFIFILFVQRTDCPDSFILIEFKWWIIYVNRQFSLHNLSILSVIYHVISIIFYYSAIKKRRRLLSLLT